MGSILYTQRWWIRWLPKNMKNYHVTKKAYISTLTGIIYTGMYSYGDANLLQYIFSRDPTKKIKETYHLNPSQEYLRFLMLFSYALVKTINVGSCHHHNHTFLHKLLGLEFRLTPFHEIICLFFLTVTQTLTFGYKKCTPFVSRDGRKLPQQRGMLSLSPVFAWQFLP